MTKITFKPPKRKADEIADAILDEYDDESQALDSDGAAADGAGNLPTPPKPKKKRKVPTLTKRKARKAPEKVKKKIPVIEADDESDLESSQDEAETQNKSVLPCYFDMHHINE